MRVGGFGLLPSGRTILASTWVVPRADGPRWAPAAMVLLAACVLAALVWPAIAAFVADDDDTWLEWSSQPLVRVVSVDSAPYSTCRPAFALLMAIEKRAFGDWLAGYRLVGFAVHVLASLLLMALVRPWLGPWRAASAALLFLVIPVHHETLFWISGRPDLLSGCAVLASMVLFETARREERGTKRALAAFAAAALALLAALLKETGIIIVPLCAGLAIFLPRPGRSVVRDVRWALLSAAPALATLALYLTRATDTSRLDHAVGALPTRAVWFLPALGALAWPLSLEEARTQTLWHLGAMGKSGAIGLAALVALAALYRVGKEARRPEIRIGLLMLVVGLAPFFLLTQPRLLFLASAGFVVLIVGLTRPRWTACVVGALVVMWGAGLCHEARLWAAATGWGRIASEQLPRLPEDEILLVDFPLDVGGVLGSDAGIARVRAAKRVEFLAPLRVSGAGGWRPSAVAAEGAALVVRRPVRWGDHLGYPCNVARMSRRIAEVSVEDCRGDASESVSVPLRDLAGVGIYQFDGHAFRPLRLDIEPQRGRGPDDRAVPTPAPR